MQGTVVSGLFEGEVKTTFGNKTMINCYEKGVLLHSSAPYSLILGQKSLSLRDLFQAFYHQKSLQIHIDPLALQSLGTPPPPK